MSNPELAVHKAIHDLLVDENETALQTFIEKRVYDRVPPSSSYPFLVLRVDVNDDSTTCGHAWEANVTINILSTAVGRQEAQTIAGQVRSIIAPLDPDDWPSFAGYETNAAFFNAATYRPGDELALTTEGVLTFTYLLDPTEEET